MPDRSHHYRVLVWTQIKEAYVLYWEKNIYIITTKRLQGRHSKDFPFTIKGITTEEFSMAD